MNTINVFIAGSKELASQRIKLKSLISDINHRNKESGINIALSVASYETYGNKQDEYNDYISNKADLVIFVLDGKIGSYTEDEFDIAKKSEKSTGRPKSVVFLKSYSDVTPDIAYINGLLKNEDYYITYANDEDLVRCVKEYLDDFVSKFAKDKISKKKLPVIKSESFPHMKYICSIGLILAALFALIYFMLCNNNSSVLLIAGGGSARNYIETYKDIVLETYPNSYHVHMPSGNAWLLLTEEVISPQATQGYIPICISASKANDEDFLKITTKDNFLKSGSIVAVKLGYDTLAITVKNDDRITDYLGHKSIKEGEVSMHNVADLLKNNDSISIFATSPGSGTKTTYERLLKEKGVVLDNMNVNQFSEYSDLPTVNKNFPYILMGSRCYKMKALERGLKKSEAYELKVYDEEYGRKIYSCKPIYVYFMAYKPSSQKDMKMVQRYGDDINENLVIPDETIKFLKDLGCDLQGKINNNVIIRKTHNSIIIDLDEL